MKNSYAIEKVLAKYPNLTYERVADCLAYSTFVDVKRRYLFYSVPKAACTTMKSLLHRMSGSPQLTYYLGETQTRREMFVHCRRNVPVPPLTALDDQTQETMMTSPEVLRFAIVRNPYTRLISAWRSKVVLCEPGFEYVYQDIRGHVPTSTKELITFPEFLDYVERTDPWSYNPHWMRQTDDLFFNAIDFTFIGKMERLNEALERFQQHLGTSEQITVGKSNRTAYKDDVGLTEAQAERIYAIYKPDFERLGYDRDDFPKVEGDPAESQGIGKNDNYSEVLERNLIIGMMARERAAMESQLRWTPSGIIAGVGRKLRRLAGRST